MIPMGQQKKDYMKQQETFAKIGKRFKTLELRSKEVDKKIIDIFGEVPESWRTE